MQGQGLYDQLYPLKGWLRSEPRQTKGHNNVLVFIKKDFLCPSVSLQSLSCPLMLPGTSKSVFHLVVPHSVACFHLSSASGICPLMLALPVSSYLWTSYPNLPHIPSSLCLPPDPTDLTSLHCSNTSSFFLWLMRTFNFHIYWPSRFL